MSMNEPVRSAAAAAVHRPSSVVVAIVSRQPPHVRPGVDACRPGDAWNGARQPAVDIDMDSTVVLEGQRGTMRSSSVRGFHTTRITDDCVFDAAMTLLRPVTILAAVAGADMAMLGLLVASSRIVPLLLNKVAAIAATAVVTRSRLGICLRMPRTGYRRHPRGGTSLRATTIFFHLASAWMLQRLAHIDIANRHRPRRSRDDIFVA